MAKIIGGKKQEEVPKKKEEEGEKLKNLIVEEEPPVEKNEKVKTKTNPFTQEILSFAEKALNRLY